MNKINIKDLEKEVNNFLKFIADSPVVKIEEGETLEVKIDAANSGLLIGRHGETLNAIQYLIRLMAQKLAGGRTNLTVDVGNYKSSKNKELEELALQVAENVKNSGYGQSLRPMNSYERRIVHVVLKDFPGVEVISSGEEPYRYIEIKPEKK